MTTYFDDPRSRESEDLAYQAEKAERSGAVEMAIDLYARAASLEQAVAESVGPDAPRVRSILAISAVSLWLRAHKTTEAAAAACTFLGQPDSLTVDARDELRHLLNRAWQEQDLRQLVGEGGTYVPVEARLSGGTIGYGLGQSQVISERRDVLAPLFVRIAEYIEQRQFRKSGLSALSARFHVLEATAAPGSFVLRFFLTTPGQQELGGILATPEAVASTFVDLAAIVAENPERLSEHVEDPEYAKAFLTSFRDLAPDGKSVGQIDLISSAQRLQHRVVFSPQTGARISAVIHKPTALPNERLVGVLKQVNLQGKRPSVGIETANGAIVHYRIEKGVHDDTIGPKLNRHVTVVATRKRFRGKSALWADDVILVDDAIAETTS